MSAVFLKIILSTIYIDSIFTQIASADSLLFNPGILMILNKYLPKIQFRTAFPEFYVYSPAEISIYYLSKYFMNIYYKFIFNYISFLL
jgi:hypothetical protein